MKKVLLFILLAISAGLTCGAQQYAEESGYLDATREKAMLYRGMMAPQYRFSYNGTFYAEQKEFLEGEIMYNGRLYRGVPLNIDACTGLVVVRSGHCFALDPDYVEYAVIGKSRYENFPEGLMKVIYRTDDLTIYSHTRKELRHDSNYHNGDDIGYEDPNYNPSVTSYFMKVVKYYVLDREGFRRIKKSALRKLTKEGRR